MRCLIIFLLVALCACGQSPAEKELANAIAEVKRTEAYVLAKAEAGDADIAADDPRVLEIAVALDAAAAFFGADRKVLAQGAWGGAWRLRQSGHAMTAVHILVESVRAYRKNPPNFASPTLASFRFFVAHMEYAQGGIPPEWAIAGYQLAKTEAGYDLEPFAPEVMKTIGVVRIVAGRMNAPPMGAAAISFYHADSVRQTGRTISTIAFMMGKRDADIHVSAYPNN